MNNPYHSPETAPISQGASALEPKSIKVFGVLHIIFGIIGILFTLLWAAFLAFFDRLMTFLIDAMAEAGPPPAGSPDPADSFKMLEQLVSSQMTYYVISAAISVVLSILLLTAGISLVKTLRNGPKLSNIWSVLAVIVLLVNVPISLFYVLPVQNEIQREFNEASGIPSAPNSEQLERTFNIIGSLFGVVIYSIYPVVALIFLKRKKVTDFLAQNGK